MLPTFVGRQKEQKNVKNGIKRVDKTRFCAIYEHSENKNGQMKQMVAALMSKRLERSHSK